jgi:hypothetical protein
MDFPDDADGDALRRVAERSDMSKPTDIDFAVDVPSKRSGEEVQRLAAQRGFRRFTSTKRINAGLAIAPNEWFRHMKR